VMAARILGPVDRNGIIVTSSREEAVRYVIRSIHWNGRTYRFEAMPTVGTNGNGSAATEWAVSRQREFIGEMTCPSEVTTGEFDLRCYQWLVELLS
jgi:hypothetical protein